jgi:hypothetical protein
MTLLDVVAAGMISNYRVSSLRVVVLPPPMGTGIFFLVLETVLERYIYWAQNCDPTVFYSERRPDHGEGAVTGIKTLPNGTVYLRETRLHYRYNTLCIRTQSAFVLQSSLRASARDFLLLKQLFERR